MLSFIAKFFKAEPAAEPTPDGRWEAVGPSSEPEGFKASDDERYAVGVGTGRVELELRKGDLFAWSDAPIPAVADASIEATLRLDGAQGRRSAGLLFRKVDDSSFLYALVSSDGAVRLDAVVNGEPRVIVPWIACPWVEEALAKGAEGAVLGIITRGKAILVIVNGRLALEAEDDAFEAGGLAFAAQSYGSPARLGLESLSVETRPLEVEADYLRYARILAADSGQRRRLAEGLFAVGYYVPALVQIKKIRSQGDGNARDGFLEAECYLRLGLLGEAQAALEGCLALDPGLEEAVEERFNLLYLRGDYLGLIAALEADTARRDASPRLLNLFGHACLGLGRFSEAAAAYESAAATEPSMPIYRRNLAEALERSGDAIGSSAAYLAAARAFYEQGAWDDAAECSRALRRRGYDKAALDSLDGLVAYGRGDASAAEALLAPLLRRGKADAPAAYVYGLLRASAGKRAEAIKAYRRAVELEPDRPIYRYRLAEALFAAGDPGFEEALGEALRAAPDDGWTLNLAGQAELAAGKPEPAERLFARAPEALPAEPAPAVNRSEALSALGRHAEAASVLGTWPERSAQAANRLGNALAAARELEAARAAYEQAVRLASAGDQELADYRVNLAAALLALGRPGDAEAELRAALELREDARALGLMGDIAGLLGDLARAELAYRAAIERSPGDPRLERRLAEHYLARRRYAQAQAQAEAFRAVDPEGYEDFMKTLREVSTERLSCASCDRAWELPRSLPAVRRASLTGQPSDDSPAGSCPSCGSIYCVACRKAGLVDGRFTCPRCGERLTLHDDRVRWLVQEGLKATRALQAANEEPPEGSAAPPRADRRTRKRPSSLPF